MIDMLEGETVAVALEGGNYTDADKRLSELKVYGSLYPCQQFGRQ